MCNGAPPTELAPWPAPQYALAARWPPQTKTTVLAVFWNVTTRSAVPLLLSKTDGEWTTGVIDVMVPP
jgi:hypothetical protein